MSEVSAGDKAKYAAAKQVWASPVLNVEPLDEVATADINQVTISYPVTALTVDNTSADWLDGNANLLFRFEEPGGTIIAWGVLRKDSTANTFYPDVKSNGDFGYATNEGISLSDDDVIRVYRNHPNWAMISRVTSAGLQKKKWDIAYTNEGTTPPPVCNMGHDQQEYIDTGTSKATFSFDASGSFGWTTGETISTFAYTLPTGAIVTGGAINTDSVEFTMPVGIYVVQLDITSSTGITRSGFRTIYANDTGSSFGESYPIESINSDNTDINGWSGQFTVLGDVSADVYPGCKCHFFAPVEYDGVRLTDNGAFIDVFIGYLTDIKITTDSNQVMRSNLTFKSPLKLAQLLPSATQTFEEVKTPTTWTQVAVGLSDPAFAAFYILQYHTTMLDNHDFFYESSIRDLRRRVFGFPADNISAQLTIVGQIMRGDVGCRSDGTITLTQEPSLLDNDGRNALDSKFTWTEESVRSKLTLGIRFRPQIAYLIMAAVAYAGNRKAPMTAFAAKAPGNAQAQGITKTNIPDISITMAGGAAELYAVIGHMFALLNNPIDKLDIPVHAMFDVADPADPDWHVLDITEATYLPIDMDSFGVRWSSIMRLRPTRVSRQWSRTNGSWVKTIAQQNRAESFGQPGVFHPTYRGQIQPYINPLSGWLDGLQITMPDINIDFDVSGLLPTSGGLNNGWLFNNFGGSGFSENFNGDHPSFTSIQISEQDIVGQTLDAGGGDAGYLLTLVQNIGITGGNLVSLYENPDIVADPTNWSLDHSWTPDVGGGYIGNVPINIMSNAAQTMHVELEETKTRYRYKPAAGAWSAQADVGVATGNRTYSSNLPPPIVLDGVEAWTMGRQSIFGGKNILMKQGSVGGGWVKVANDPAPAASGTGWQITMIARSGTNLFVVYAISTTSQKLYRIDDATSTWTDITPAGGYLPLRYNAFAASGGTLWMVGTDPLEDNTHEWIGTHGAKHLLTSFNSGTNWTDLGETKYDWLYLIDFPEVFLLGGDGVLDVTVNNMGTFHSRLGQWGNIGSVGQMQRFDSEGLL